MDLKTCPFCGSLANGLMNLSKENYERQFVLVCHQCGARGPIKDIRNESIEAWNNQPAIQRAIKAEALLEKVKTYFEYNDPADDLYDEITEYFSPLPAKGR